MINRYKIAIVEPAPLLLAGVKALLEESGEFEVAYTFNTLHGYEIRASHIQPDVLIVSPALFDFSNRSSIRSFFAVPDGLALVGLVTAHYDEKTLRQFDAVIDIFDDLQSVMLKLRSALKLNSENADSGDSYNLSDRELEILVSVAKGLTNKEIAELHDISVNTVITHRKNISRKTGIKSVSGLTVYALLNNLIDQTDVE
ncbi:MAG: response regulator transcription factor [Paludibacteraceae bacterium]|nr:response regulator transcription factor [Paludibacteraceae bacterium]